MPSLQGSTQRMSVRDLVIVKITRPPHGSVHWGHTCVQLALTKFTIPQNKILLFSFIYYISKCVYFKRFLKEITTLIFDYFFWNMSLKALLQKSAFLLYSAPPINVTEDDIPGPVGSQLREACCQLLWAVLLWEPVSYSVASEGTKNKIKFLSLSVIRMLRASRKE